ncbi:uncharacterized protein LOC115678968 [Syzygium oleosum]|uniref:uncharacterized protein LOC115678968 n=1 Tax=Syzygium oleosum TaxID=219896 RepID=UPI0024B9F1C4|nr:uncharacterized protein LOC115678968 [Syzygium oleosum]
MMVKKGVQRKWVVIAVAVYLLIMCSGSVYAHHASLLPAQHVPDAPGGSEEGKMGSPRKALGGRGGFKLKGTITLDSYVDLGKKKKRKTVESRSLRASAIGSLPSPLCNYGCSQAIMAPLYPIT